MSHGVLELDIWFGRYDDMKGTRYVLEVNDETKTIVFSNELHKIGLFSKSTITVLYGKDGSPMKITEKVLREDCSDKEWKILKRSLKSKVKSSAVDLGYKVSAVFKSDYMEYTHSKKVNNLGGI